MRPSQNVWWGSLVLKGLGWVPVQLGARALQAPSLPAAVPHPRSAAGTPHCSPVAPAHTVAPASSLSETWGPEPRTPGGWVCWAHLQPSGSLKTGGHSQFLAGGSLGGSPPSDLPRLSHLCWPLASRLTQPATSCPGHPAPPWTTQSGCGPCPCLERVSTRSWPPPPPQLVWPPLFPQPITPGRAEAILGISIDGDEKWRVKCWVWAVAAMNRWVTDGAGQLWRREMATPVLPGPRKGAAGCPARIIVSRESPEGGNPFI